MRFYSSHYFNEIERMLVDRNLIGLKNPADKRDLIISEKRVTIILKLLPADWVGFSLTALHNRRGPLSSFY
jgi:hypothetical protein